jgi:hypothetical protein
VSEVYHIRNMSTEKAFDMISGELESAKELWRLIKTEVDRMDICRRQIISTDKSSAWNNMDNLQKYEYINDTLDAIKNGGNLISKKIDNVIEKVMFIIHIGGTCKSLTLNDTDMIFADMNLMMQRLQGTQEKINSNLILVEKCYKHLNKD